MQLNRSTAEDPNVDHSASAPSAEAPQSELIREYELRRCNICQCRYPSFGFVPPMTNLGRAIWACLTHRGEVERRLSLSQTLAMADSEPRLL